MCCLASRPDAIARIYELKDLDPKKSLSVMVADLALAGRWVRSMPTHVYRLMKRVLPGPYTFILNASREVPKIMLRKRKTLGIRIPDNPIALAVLEQLDAPLLTTSIRSSDDQIVNDPSEISLRFGQRIDLVVDGGPLLPIPSTVVDFTGPAPEVVRVGKGSLENLGLVDE